MLPGRAAAADRSERRPAPSQGAGRLQGGEIDGLAQGCRRVLPPGDGDELRGIKWVQAGSCPEGRAEKVECSGVVPAGTRAGFEHDITDGFRVNIRPHTTGAGLIPVPVGDPDFHRYAVAHLHGGGVVSLCGCHAGHENTVPRRKPHLLGAICGAGCAKTFWEGSTMADFRTGSGRLTGGWVHPRFFTDLTKRPVYGTLGKSRDKVNL